MRRVTRYRCARPRNGPARCVRVRSAADDYRAGASYRACRCVRVYRCACNYRPRTYDCTGR